MGLKNVIAECVQQGKGTVEEGKRELSFELYKKLMEWGTTGKEAFFFRSYLGNTWNFMCRSKNTERLCHKHFVWNQDSAGVPFAHGKNNQAGDPRKMKPLNLYLDPFDPRVHTILATFEYNMVVFPEVLADLDGPLYPGSQESQSNRFSRMLAVVLKAHEKEVNEMGYNILEIGVHSIQKGATTFISSGTTAAPSSMSVDLRGGWSMGGSVRNVYMLYKKAWDQYIGRLMAELPVLLEKLAVSNPDFILMEENDLFVPPVPETPENKAELKEMIQVAIEGIFGR